MNCTTITVTVAFIATLQVSLYSNPYSDPYSDPEVRGHIPAGSLTEGSPDQRAGS